MNSTVTGYHILVIATLMLSVNMAWRGSYYGFGYRGSDPIDRKLYGDNSAFRAFAVRMDKLNHELDHGDRFGELVLQISAFAIPMAGMLTLIGGLIAWAAGETWHVAGFGGAWLLAFETGWQLGAYEAGEESFPHFVPDNLGSYRKNLDFSVPKLAPDNSLKWLVVRVSAGAGGLMLAHWVATNFN